MLSILRRRPAFRRLWIAANASLIGDWLSFVAISLLAMDRGGGALSLALVFAVHALPHALFTPISGVVADRLDRRTLLIVVPLVQAALTVAMALAAGSGILWLVQVLVLVRSAGTAFMVPAEAAALRHTVEPDELVPANAILSGTWSLTFVAGMALGGAIASLGAVPAILIDACTFVLAAALLAQLPPMPVEGRTGGESGRIGALLTAVPRDLWAALVYAVARPSLFLNLFAKAPLGLAGGAGWVVLNTLSNEEKPFGSAAISLGVLQAVRGAGTGLGPFGAAALKEGRRGGWIVDHAVVFLSLIGVALFPMASGAPVLLLFIAFVWGLGTGSNWVLSTAEILRQAPDSMLGRLSSVDDLSATLTIVVGALISGALLESGASRVWVAAFGSVIGLCAWVLLVRMSAAKRTEAAMVG